MSREELYLFETGWREVPAGHGRTCWRSPVDLTGKGHYFSLEAAYALETTGEGIWAYSVRQSLAGAVRGQDVALNEAQEHAYHAATGQWHGIAPYW